jgi:hypothetical protein
MATIWKSTNQTNQTTHKTLSGTMLSSWSRQQKLAMFASLAILGLLLVVSACSKQSSKPALVAVSSPAATTPTPTPTAATMPATDLEAEFTPAPAKKVQRKRSANVTYSDANSGVSFLYPRKFELISGDKAQPQLSAVGDVPMNFTQPGGTPVATVTLPGGSYPGTDFEAAFFNVNLNRSVSEQECSHFAFVDTRNADDEPVDAEKVKVGSTEMEMTSDFTANVMKQAETQYYHNYENGACYEYVLGLGTEGFATQGGIAHVDRDQVFAKLEKILASVTIKVKPDAVEPEHIAEQTGADNGLTSGKE